MKFENIKRKHFAFENMLYVNVIKLRSHFGSSRFGGLGQSEGSSKECGRRRASGAGATSHVHSWRRSSAAADPLKASCAADGFSLS